MVWHLNLDAQDHRVCDFPHAACKAGSLGDFGQCLATDRWILEIQFAHPTRPFGAVYKDLLVADDAAGVHAPQSTAP